MKIQLSGCIQTVDKLGVGDYAQHHFSFKTSFLFIFFKINKNLAVFQPRFSRIFASVQGDVGKLPTENETFDMVLSMNGFHTFPDKDKAFQETWRVLKKDGTFIACFYIKEKSRVTDWLQK